MVIVAHDGNARRFPRQRKAARNDAQVHLDIMTTSRDDPQETCHREPLAATTPELRDVRLVQTEVRRGMALVEAIDDGAELANELASQLLWDVG